VKTLLLALWMIGSADPHRPIELRVVPTVCLAPCSVRASVRIEPHTLNRWWVIQVDGPMSFGGMRQLDGDAAAITQPDVWFVDLPAGEYEIVAVVYRQQKHSEAGRASSRASVVGPL